MSEKEIRTIGVAFGESHDSYVGTGCTCDCPLCCKLEIALSADPDLVVLLRWLGAEATALYESEGHNSPMARAHDETVDYIESELGVRLTDGGWEWVDDDDGFWMPEDHEWAKPDCMP